MATNILNLWQVTLRDVIILDEQNVPRAVYNLNANDLGISANYNTLLDLFVNSTYPGNFDADDSVDGLDFLMWQLGFGSTYDANDLADWENNFGPSAPPLSASTAAIPEPTACALALATLSIMILGRRGRSSV